MTINRNLSILAEGASSSGVLGTANGGTGLSSVGTSGNVLTSNGSAWVSSTPSAGAMTLISTQTGNNTSTTISWTGLSGYSSYQLILRNISPTAADSLYMQLGTGSSPTWVTSGYAESIVWGDTFSASIGGLIYNTTFAIQVTGQKFGGPGDSNDGINLIMTFNNMNHSVAGNTTFLGSSLTYISGYPYEQDIFGGALTGSAVAKTALKIYFGSNNIQYGTASLYGISS